MASQRGDGVGGVPTVAMRYFEPSLLHNSDRQCKGDCDNNDNANDHLSNTMKNTNECLGSNTGNEEWELVSSVHGCIALEDDDDDTEGDDLQEKDKRQTSTTTTNVTECDRLSPTEQLERAIAIQKAMSDKTDLDILQEGETRLEEANNLVVITPLFAADLSVAEKKMKIDESESAEMTAATGEELLKATMNDSGSNSNISSIFSRICSVEATTCTADNKENQDHINIKEHEFSTNDAKGVEKGYEEQDDENGEERIKENVEEGGAEEGEEDADEAEDCADPGFAQYLLDDFPASFRTKRPNHVRADLQASCKRFVECSKRLPAETKGSGPSAHAQKDHERTARSEVEVCTVVDIAKAEAVGAARKKRKATKVLCTLDKNTAALSCQPKTTCAPTATVTITTTTKLTASPTSVPIDQTSSVPTASIINIETKAAAAELPASVHKQEKDSDSDCDNGSDIHTTANSNGNADTYNDDDFCDCGWDSYCNGERAAGEDEDFPPWEEALTDLCCPDDITSLLLDDFTIHRPLRKTARCPGDKLVPRTAAAHNKKKDKQPGNITILRRQERQTLKKISARTACSQPLPVY